MIVTTMFRHADKYELGEVELKLLPGIPQLQVVGLPDAAIKECGVKIRSALRSLSLKWPSGHMVVANLRPSSPRKVSAGAELAIALGLLALTDQLPPHLLELTRGAVVYGEIGLDGRVFAPGDLEAALIYLGSQACVSGVLGKSVRYGSWTEIETLVDPEPKRREHVINWEFFWQRPERSELSLSPPAAAMLTIATHAQLSVLLAGPPGSGKTTWARTLYALSPTPVVKERLELARMVGEEAWDLRWRPFEQPHHSSSPLAMVGGGVPLRAGVISRAHGGILLLDEFLEFHPRVQEALREPMENGSIELARGGERSRWPCRFQTIATTNLCPCGRMVPGFNKACGYNIGRCQSVWRRLSGPVVDRFDLLGFTDGWLRKSEKSVTTSQIADRIARAAEFARSPKRQTCDLLPPGYADLTISHRRRRALLRIARTLADLEECMKVAPRHFLEAAEYALNPMDELRQLFA